MELDGNCEDDVFVIEEMDNARGTVVTQRT